MTEQNELRLVEVRKHQDVVDQKEINFRIQQTNADEDQKWDDFLAHTQGGSHLQTSKWAQVKIWLGWKVIRVVATKENNIIGGAQVLLRPLGLGQTIGYVPRGPLLVEDHQPLATQITEVLKEIAKDQNCLMLVVQPPKHHPTLIELLYENQFKPGTLEVAPTATVLIDLLPEHEEILARMKRGTRYNIGLSARKEVTIYEGDRNHLAEFYRLLQDTSRRQKFNIYPKDYYTEMWDILEPGNNIKLFLATYRSEVISAQLAIAFGDTVVNKMTVWSGEHGKLRPNEGLLWGVMQWAKEQGYRYYDLEGIERAAAESIMRDEDLPESIKATVTHFKLGFGGDVVLFPPSYTLVQNPIARWVYHTIIDQDTLPPPIKTMVDRMRISDNR